MMSNPTSSNIYQSLAFELPQFIISYYKNITNNKEKNNYKRTLIDLFEKFYQSIYELAKILTYENLILTNSIGDFLLQINSIIVYLIKNSDVSDDIEQELKRVLKGNIYLPSCFKIDFIDDNSKLIDSIAKTSIKIFESEIWWCCDELINKCTNSLNKIALSKLETAQNNRYIEIRIIMKICFIGIMAIKYKKQSIVINIKLKIEELNLKYCKKYIGTINKKTLYDELNRELDRWKQEHSAIQSIYVETSEDIILKQVTLDDINQFISEIFDTRKPI